MVHIHDYEVPDLPDGYFWRLTADGYLSIEEEHEERTLLFLPVRWTETVVGRYVDRPDLIPVDALSLLKEFNNLNRFKSLAGTYR